MTTCLVFRQWRKESHGEIELEKGNGCIRRTLFFQSGENERDDVDFVTNTNLSENWMDNNAQTTWRKVSLFSERKGEQHKRLRWWKEDEKFVLISAKTSLTAVVRKETFTSKENMMITTVGVHQRWCMPSVMIVYRASFETRWRRWCWTGE